MCREQLGEGGRAEQERVPGPSIQYIGGHKETGERSEQVLGVQGGERGRAAAGGAAGERPSRVPTGA